MTLTAPPDLQAITPADLSSRRGPATLAFERFYQLLSPPGGREAPVVFCHERQAPHGEARLIVIQAWIINDNTGDPTTARFPVFLRARVFRPGGLTRAPSEIAQRVGREDDEVIGDALTTTINAGQIDPSEPDHFTINGMSAGRPFTFDGWLSDDGSVSLDVRPLTPAPRPGTRRRTVGP